MPWDVQTRGGIFLPQIDWWLDATRPVARSFVSHAHFDHMAKHKLSLCTKATARLMHARQYSNKDVTALPFGEPHELAPGCTATLHPAGHILGSAQLLADSEHGRLLYTGDFKLRPGRSSEICATPRADLLIMETTFGTPAYRMPPTGEVLAALVQFCRDALAARAVPVLFGYSLGKAQEILASLGESGLPVMLHSEVFRLTRLCERLGVTLPAYREFELKEMAGHVVIAPPQSGKSSWFTKITPRRTAMVTGWAVEPSARYRFGTDAAFALSDHADYDDLLAFVDRVQPQKVFTVHGFAAEFAATLRARGIEAWALGKENQLEFGLGGSATLLP